MAIAIIRKYTQSDSDNQYYYILTCAVFSYNIIIHVTLTISLNNSRIILFLLLIIVVFMCSSNSLIIHDSTEH